MGVFVARRAVFHAMMQSIQSLVDVLSKVVVNDRPALDALVADMRDLTGLMGQHNDLMRNMLQASPILMREAANITATATQSSVTALAVRSSIRGCAQSADAPSSLG